MSHEIQEPATVQYFQRTQKLMREWGSECTGLQSHLLEVFSQLESMRARLAHTEDEMKLKCDHLAKREKELERLRDAARRQQSEQRGIDRKLARAEQARTDLEAERQRTRRQRQLNDELQARLEKGQQRLESVQRERDQLQSDLDAASRDAADAARLATALKDAQHELAQTRAEHQSDARQVLPMPNQQKLSRGEQPPLTAEALADWEEERSALDRALEQARRRAAKLADTLAEERSRFASERRAWSEQLGRMRTQAGTRVFGVNPGAAASLRVASTATGAATTTSGEKKDDALVDCVLAQFAQFRDKDGSRKAPARCAATA